MVLRDLILLPDQVKTAPVTPGVYVMRNKSRQVIYVGKAINLKRRLQSYFRQARAEGGTEEKADEKLSELVPRVAKITVKQTGSELEALLLEAKLIKQYQPIFNQKIKHFHHHVYLRVSRGSRFPQISIERNIESGDEADFYGPFSGKTSLEYMLDGFNQVFKLRTCDLTTFLTHSDRPCVRYEEGLCSAPCADHISSQEYQELLTEFIGYLSGKPSRRVLEFIAALEEETETVVEFEEEAEDEEQGPDLLTKLTGYLPASYHENNCLIVLPDLLPGSYKLLAVLHGKPCGIVSFKPEKQGERKLRTIVRAIYQNFQTLPPSPVTKELFEEAKIIDRWLHQDELEHTVIDLQLYSDEACLQQLKRQLFPSYQLSLFFDANVYDEEDEPVGSGLLVGLR